MLNEIMTYLTIEEIINLSQTCSSYYSNMNQSIYNHIRKHDIYKTYKLYSYASVEDYARKQHFKLLPYEFIITCHKETTLWREHNFDDYGYMGTDSGENNNMLIMTINPSLTYTTYLFKSYPWFSENTYYLLDETTKYKFINIHLAKMNKEEILSYPEKNQITYSFIESDNNNHL